MTALVLLFGALVSLSAANSLWAQGNTNLPADLQTLIVEALKVNPEIKQMAELKSASKETIRSVGALDSPASARSRPSRPRRKLPINPPGTN
jgi:hypothetical protein